VSACYPGRAAPALSDISFQAWPGSVTAIVGRSGSGKSTLAKLIPRLYEYTSGEILLDGRPVEEYRLADLRRQVAMVPQHVALFDGTLAGNVAYGELEKRPAPDVEAALGNSNALEFIRRLPRGAETAVGPAGANLSGGQRQRIALARALLKDAPILILDEATASLDPESERLVEDTHLLKLPLDFFEKRHLGDITSRMGAVQAIQKTVTTSFVEAIIDGLMAAVTLGMMLLYSWKLAVVTLVAVALYLALRGLVYRPLRDGTEQQLVKAARQQSHLLETIRGIQSVKVAACETARRSTFLNLLQDTVNQDVRLSRFGLGFSAASQLIFGIERIAVIWIGAVLALQNVFSVGMLVAYLAYKDQFAQRVSGLIDKWIEFRMLRLHGERLADIVLAEPERDRDGIGSTMGKPRDAGLEVEGLSFRYADGEPWVLKDCHFSVTDGESVAIVGASGCGKTTLVKLLLGLLTPTGGAIALGGMAIDRLGHRNYRQLVGAVMQDDQLFAGTIAENIALGDDGYDQQRVENAARMASVHEEIVSMPMGYHSLIGDMGTTLSGGQKQRVILARALYREPRILFLDEATSHLDVERERLVNDAVRGLKLTRIIIAHRPETIASADRVLVMHGGRIVQEIRAPLARAPVVEGAMSAEQACTI